jgi:F-type H+-transporting ATPase subunit a
MMAINKAIFTLILSVLSIFTISAQHEGHNHAVGEGHNVTSPAHPQQTQTTEATHGAAPTTAVPTEAHGNTAHAGGECVPNHTENEEFNAGENAIHHIADANAIHLWGDTYIPLPAILYAPTKGWTTMMTSAFHPHHHGNGAIAKDGYVLVHGNIQRVISTAFPMGDVPVGEIVTHKVRVNEKEKEISYVDQAGTCYQLEKKTSWDGGLVGGGPTGFYDFSITRNVFTMLLTFFILFLLLRSVANSAVRTAGQAPKGLQNFFEPLITFIRDEVAKPNIGPKYEKYMPYLLSAFFFILGLNLVGQIPFFPGSANVTGNISVTIVLALITFIISTFSANKHFWEHTLWMPGVPAVLKILILTPIEILGLFLKPFTLLLRLFANITAGHIVIMSFVSLIFIFGKAGASIGGSAAGAAASIPLTLFMMTLELLVAFLQAFIFTMLSATYIGTAIEEPHHH